MSNDVLLLRESIARLGQWVEAHDYKGYEPFDGLASFLRPLTFGNLRLQQVLVQIGRRSPINLRPVLGIRPLASTKGRAYMARGHLTLFLLTGEAKHREKATACLDWLIGARSHGFREFCWGNDFDYATRAGKIAKHEPTTVWTSLIGQAFLDGYQALGDRRYLEVAESACAWILELPRERTATGACLSYLAGRQLSVHNANLLAAAMLARTAGITGSSDHSDVARNAVAYSCSHQRPDGAWYYAEGPMYRWIDAFHTGYDLDSLRCYIDSTGDEGFRQHLDIGFEFFKQHFFEPDGRVRYYNDRAPPTEIQCASQSIETLVTFSDRDHEALRMALDVALWTIRNMQDPDGYFHYRKYRHFTAKIPMMHWGQATMFRALALLLWKMESSCT